MELHPLHTMEILQRVGVFKRFARTASLHHEKLDGSGYPYGVKGDALDLPSRILVVSDIYDALPSDRPYRAGMSHEKATEIMERERGVKLCDRALDALGSVKGRGDANPLSHRRVEPATIT